MHGAQNPDKEPMKPFKRTRAHQKKREMEESPTSTGFSCTAPFFSLSLAPPFTVASLVFTASSYTQLRTFYNFQIIFFFFFKEKTATKPSIAEKKMAYLHRDEALNQTPCWEHWQQRFPQPRSPPHRTHYILCILFIRVCIISSCKNIWTVD